MSAGAQPKPAWEVVRANARRVGGVVMLMLLNVFFWGVYEQQGDSLALFIDERARLLKKFISKPPCLPRPSTVSWRRALQL